MTHDYWLIGKYPEEKTWHYYGSFSTQESAENEMERRHAFSPSQEYKIAIPKPC